MVIPEDTDGSNNRHAISEAAGMISETADTMNGGTLRRSERIKKSTYQGKIKIILSRTISWNIV